MAMNAPEAQITFVPKQAFAPTPQLYDELVAGTMANLAKASLAQLPTIPAGAVILDNGCGTGAATEALVAITSDVIIKANDINEEALKVYRQQAVDGHWPAEAVNMDSATLAFSENTFSHIIGNALLFVLPNDGVDTVKEMYRTLQPGGVAIVNTWAYVPNMAPIQMAAKATRPEGTPLPREGSRKWSDMEFLRGVVEQGGFEPEKIRIVQETVVTKTCELRRYANMLWSFIGGTTSVGWLESDEQNWERALEVIFDELSKTEGYREEEGRAVLQFVANIVIATK